MKLHCHGRCVNEPELECSMICGTRCSDCIHLQIRGNADVCLKGLTPGPDNNKGCPGFKEIPDVTDQLADDYDCDCGDLF